MFGDAQNWGLEGRQREEIKRRQNAEFLAGLRQQIEPKKHPDMVEKLLKARHRMREVLDELRVVVLRGRIVGASKRSPTRRRDEM